MLLKVQVQPICTFETLFVLFLQVMVPHVIAIFCFSLLGKVKMFYALRSNPFSLVFLSLKAKIKAQLSINTS